jgi:hypothetical protein
MERYDELIEVEKRYDEIEEVRKYNHNHGWHGRFVSAADAGMSSGGGGASRGNSNGGAGGSGGSTGGNNNPGDPKGTMKSAKGGYFDETDTGAFTEAVAKAQSKIDADSAWRVSAPSKEEFEAEHPGAKMHITKNGSTIAVAGNGDIVSVCGTPPDHGKDLIDLAVANGGTKCDSFSGLYGFYRKCGMEPRSVCEFSEEFAPPGWVKGRDDPEPIIFWEFTGNKSTKSKVELIKERDEWLASQKVYSGENGYGDAMAVRDEMMKGRDQK